MPQPARYRFAEEWQRYGPTAPRRPGTLADASAYCRWMARSQYENFVVGSLLLPRELQSHFYHVYAFCRWADDLGDELGDTGASLEALAWWKGELLAMYQGNAWHPILQALQQTVQQFNIAPEPFLDLLSAFEQDQRLFRYEQFDQLLDYCRRSANPVGRLVLSLFQETQPLQLSLSDEICTGLQLANFWQDVRRDYAKGRIYLPQEDIDRFGCTVFFQSADQQPLPAGYRDLLRFQAERTAGYFQRGRSLILNLKPAHQSEIDLIVRGGELLLDRITAIHFDTWTTRPTLSKWTQANLLLAALWRRWRRPRSPR